VITLAREFIEDWLTKRGQDVNLEDAAAYEKIIEVYSLHVLAGLGAWEDAREFMRYEENYLRKSSRYKSIQGNFIPADHRVNSACFKSWK
jgi:hypothetical protein